MESVLNFLEKISDERQGEKSPANLKVAIAEVEKDLLKMPQVACPVVHRFGPGIYMREVRVPAGTLTIGHHQNFEHQNLFLQGRVTILNDDGSTTELKAPMSFVGKPGRKIGFIHEDMVWLNIYATNETDVEKLEQTFLTKSEDWINGDEARTKVLSLQSSVDNNDFLDAISETGFTFEQVKAMSENESDLTELPFGGYKIKVSRSNIQGQGLFATGDIEPDEIIAPARILGKRTIAGRFTNHSASPNARMVKASGDDIDLVAIRKIQGCHGGFDGEEITINYREAVSLTRMLFKGGDKCQV